MSTAQSANANLLEYSSLVRASKRLLPGVTTQTLRLALLADASTQHLVPLLRVLFYRSGIDCSVYEAPFDSIELETYNPASDLYAFAPEVILVLNSVQALRAQYAKRPNPAAGFVEETASGIVRIWQAIRQHSNATILQSNLVLPYERHFGNFDHKVADSFYSVVLDLNSRIVSESRAFHSVLINDVEAVASWIGRKHWFDDRFWDMAKSFCALEQLPYVAQNVVGIVSALHGRVTKCVVLDLDNTLWGGVIGDDGLDGIKLNAHGEGEAFHRLQQFLRELLNRGILLAICSKNDMANALLPFEKHPEMVLKRNDITCFVANWQDKAENIRHIRETLNIGWDSIVFLDDNPFERNLVRELLPGVVVPELPEDPADYVRAIAELNLFETTSFSSEDVQRSELYRKEAERKEQQASFASLEEFLASLEMKMTVSIFDSYQVPRISQLLQRSNQFNLTTQRRSEAECSALMVAENIVPLYVTLKDRFGDHGLISVVILEIRGEELAITDWLMSCRVLKRGVEQAMMNLVFDYAARLALTRVTGEYRPTAKNAMVKDFFSQFNFNQAGEEAGATRWTKPVASYRAYPVFVECLDQGVQLPTDIFSQNALYSNH